MLKANKRLLKGYFIYPAFQTRFIGFLVFFLGLTTLVHYAAVQYFFTMFESKGAAVGIPAHHIYFKFIDGLRGDMNLIFLTTTSICLVVMVVGAIVLSHRVAGPMYRLQKDFEEMAENQMVRPVKFRSYDFFSDIPQKFNEVIERCQLKK